MYRGYNLQGFDTTFFGSELSTRVAAACFDVILDSPEQNIKRNLESFLNVDGSVNGSQLQGIWFPEIKADVFISHSRKDMDLAKALAYRLHQNFGLISFIDSVVWGYADDLLLSIDDRYCPSADGEGYNYQDRNRSTSHVHMMLSTALGKMIDKTECILFLNTPNSIKTSDIKLPKTHSPWLLMEVGLASMIQRKKQRRVLHEDYSIRTASALPDFEYDIEEQLKQLTTITTATLTQWSAAHEPDVMHALDKLYEITPN